MNAGSTYVAMVVLAPMCSRPWPSPPSAATLSSAVSIAPITSRAFSRNDSPVRVSRMPFGVRSSSSNPQLRSRSRTARETAGWLTPMARAAAVKPPCSATATNARSSAGLRFITYGYVDDNVHTLAL